MPTLGPLGPRVAPQPPSSHPRHQPALPLVRRLLEAGRARLDLGRLHQLENLARVLESMHPVSLPPDNHWIRSCLTDLSRSASGPHDLVADLSRDILLCLFSPRPPIFLRCEPPTDLVRLEAIHRTVCSTLLHQGPSALIHACRPALSELSSSLGADHHALETLFLSTQGQSPSPWVVCEQHLLRCQALYDGLRFRFLSEYGTHAVHFGPVESPTPTPVFDPIFGRIEGQWTITGFSEGFWGKPVAPLPIIQGTSLP